MGTNENVLKNEELELIKNAENIEEIEKVECIDNSEVQTILDEEVIVENVEREEEIDSEEVAEEEEETTEAEEEQTEVEEENEIAKEQKIDMQKTQRIEILGELLKEAEKTQPQKKKWHKKKNKEIVPLLRGFAQNPPKTPLQKKPE